MVKQRENCRSKVREDGIDRKGKCFPLLSYVHSLGSCELTDKIQIDKRRSVLVSELTKEVVP